MDLPPGCAWGPRRRLLRRLLEPEIIPDPRGLVGLALIVGVLVSHLALAAGPRQFLFSEDPGLEVLGHVWLLLGPLVSLYLGLRSLLVAQDSLLPLVSLPLASLVTAVTAGSLCFVALVG